MEDELASEAWNRGGVKVRVTVGVGVKVEDAVTEIG